MEEGGRGGRDKMWRREGKVDKETEEEEQRGKLNQREREREKVDVERRFSC